MLEVKHLLRQAYLTALTSLEYDGTSIIGFDEYVNEPEKRAIIPNLPNAYMWYVVTNQTVNEADSKCTVNQDLSIQIDVCTQFQGNTGGNIFSERLTNNIYALLYPNGGHKMELTLSDPSLNMWRSYLVSSRNITEEFSNYRIYRNVLIFNHSIKQNG